MIQSFEREIKGNKYTITAFAARPNLLFISKWTKQLKAIAPLLKNLAEKGYSNIDTDDLDFAGMLESFCDSLNPQTFSDLVFDSFKSVNVITGSGEDEKAINLAIGNIFDEYFAGKMGHLFVVLWEILKINVFGGNKDFFSEAITKVKTVIGKGKTK